MKININILLSSILLSSVLFTACKKAVKFKTTSDGLEYRFIKTDNKSEKAEINDALIVDMKLYWNDSLMFNSRDVSLNYKLKLEKPHISGSLNEGLEMMHKGDSAIFKIDAYKFYTITADIPAPKCIKKGDKLIFYVKLIDIMSPAEVQKDFERYKKRQIKNEQDLLDEYLENNNINTKPTKDGLYFVIIKKGYGRKPHKGDSVYVHYEGKLINNQPFESTLVNNKPFGFIYGKENFIDGWNEGIGMMRQGETARLIIPSKIGYGDKGAGDIIPPYSTIIFDIHLLKVKRNK